LPPLDSGGQFCIAAVRATGKKARRQWALKGKDEDQQREGMNETIPMVLSPSKDTKDFRTQAVCKKLKITVTKIPPHGKCL
jgi:hypothetical protein